MAQPGSFNEAVPSLWRVLSHFWPQTRKHGWLITGSWIALFLEVLFRLLEPWPLKIVFDRVVNKMHGAHGYKVSLFDIFQPTTLLAMMAGLMVALTALRAVAGYWTTVGFAKIGNRVLAQACAVSLTVFSYQRKDWRPCRARHKRCWVTSGRCRDGGHANAGQSVDSFRHGRVDVLAELETRSGGARGFSPLLASNHQHGEKD